MNSFKSWRVSVSSPEMRDAVETYLLNNSGAISVDTAVTFIKQFLSPWDDVVLTTDEGVVMIINSDE